MIYDVVYNLIKVLKNLRFINRNDGMKEDAESALKIICLEKVRFVLNLSQNFYVMVTQFN